MAAVGSGVFGGSAWLVDSGAWIRRFPTLRPGRGHRPLGLVLDGRYRVDALIAVGGMATVYRALDTAWTGWWRSR